MEYVFKPEDIVVCISNDGAKSLQLNKEYTIKRVCKQGVLFCEVEETKTLHIYWCGRFKLIYDEEYDV